MQQVRDKTFLSTVEEVLGSPNVALMMCEPLTAALQSAAARIAWRSAPITANASPRLQ